MSVGGRPGLGWRVRDRKKEFIRGLVFDRQRERERERQGGGEAFWCVNQTRQEDGGQEREGEEMGEGRGA
jgi:hypothetical protein